MMRRVLALSAVALVVVLAGCGGDDGAKPAAGTPENPLPATLTEGTSSGRSNEGQASTGTPNYQKLVERQTAKPQSRFTPCNLVTRAEAKAILGAPVQAPLEAPQGPTCVYRSTSSASFITVAVQARSFDELRKDMRARVPVEVGGRPGYCGTYGQPMMVVSLAQGRVLSIGAPCDVARKFAARGVARLGS
jgi:hypothetical protein